MDFLTSYTQLRQVCAVIDAQGFAYGSANDKSSFVPVELSVVGNKQAHHILYDLTLDSCMTGHQFTTYLHQSRKIHGIRIKTSSTGNVVEIQKKLRDDILALYEKHKTAVKTRFAVHNSNLVPILSELGIPIVNLSTPYAVVPRLNELDDKYGNANVCSVHTYERPHLRCSQRKALHYLMWLNEAISSVPTSAAPSRERCVSV